MAENVNIVAEFTAHPGSEGGLIQALSSVAGPTRQEAGCLRFELQQSRDDTQVVTAIERFQDQAAVDAHVAMPYIVDLFENKLPQLVESQRVVFYSSIET